MDIRFDDKVAIVTGAGGGIGQQHALDLARRGAKVVVNDLGGAPDGTGGSSEAAEKVVAEIKAAGGEAIANGSSVTDEAGMKKMVEDAQNAFGGRIDILVNNAGILRDKSFSKMTMEDFEVVLNVHLMGTVKPTKAVWEIMKAQNYGRIIVTSSTSGIYGNFGQTNYGAAKMAVVGFINTLKLEGQKYNIRANALVPVAWTRLTENLMPKEAEALLKPEFVTPMVTYAVSEDAPNGKMLCAGAGVFSVAEITESEGMFIARDGVTAEQVAENWEKISDKSKACGYFSGGEQSQKVMGMSMKH